MNMPRNQEKAKEFVTRIRWGSKSIKHENPDAVCTYTFKTKAEQDAFLRGVKEASGWIEMPQVVEDGEPAFDDIREQAIAGLKKRLK